MQHRRGTGNGRQQRSMAVEYSPASFAGRLQEPIAAATAPIVPRLCASFAGLLWPALRERRDGAAAQHDVDHSSFQRHQSSRVRVARPCRACRLPDGSLDGAAPWFTDVEGNGGVKGTGWFTDTSLSGDENPWTVRRFLTRRVLPTQNEGRFDV